MEKLENLSTPELHQILTETLVERGIKMARSKIKLWNSESTK